MPPELQKVPPALFPKQNPCSPFRIHQALEVFFTVELLSPFWNVLQMES